MNLFESILPPVDEPSFVCRRETRVTSAITISHLESWIERFAPVELSEFFVQPGLEESERCIKRTKSYAQYLFTQTWLKNNHKPKIEDDVLSVVDSVLQVSTRNWANCDLILPVRDINESDLIRKLYAIRQEWDKMVFVLSNTNDKVCSYKIKKYKMSFTFLGDHCVCQSETRTIYPTWMMILAFQDAITGLFDAAIFSRLEDSETSYKLGPNVERFIYDGTDSVIFLGERVYDVLKALHPAAVGLLIKRDGGYENNLQQTTLEEMAECPLKHYFARDPGSLEDDMMLLMLSGLCKCFTYPVINIQGSVDNVLEKSKVFDPDTK